MNTPIISILYFVLASLLGALGQFLYKEGAAISNSGGLLNHFNWRILVGVLCYIGVMGLFIAAFKRGGSPTVLYPVYATTFIWAACIAYFAYGTAIKPVHVAGMFCLILGMYLMGRS